MDVKDFYQIKRSKDFKTVKIKHCFLRTNWKYKILLNWNKLFVSIIAIIIIVTIIIITIIIVSIF